VGDSDFALDKGLFADKFESAGFKKSHRRNKEDFLELARRIRIEKPHAEKLLEPFYKNKIKWMPGKALLLQ
jgi:serine/threonine-protein kinase HipA